MTANSKIEWTDRTWNPVRAENTATGKRGHFCIHVSEGCRNCYAERWQPWRGTGLKDSYRKSFLDTGRIRVFLDEKTLLAPLRWRKPCKCFVCDMTDLFGEWVPEDWIVRVFATFLMTPHITWQVLTKRGQRMQELLGSTRFMRRVFVEAGIAMPEANRESISHGRWPLPNLHLGVSVEDQATVDLRVPLLLDTPAAVRFISAEPLLGPVNFRVPMAGAHIDALRGAKPAWSPLDWVIVGGESGPEARPMEIAWARDIVRQCRAAKVPVFVKQMGSSMARSYSFRDKKGGDPAEWLEDLRVREFPGERT
jgi:protein gp37